MVFGFRKKETFEGGGLILFNAVEEAIKGERLLKEAGIDAKLVAPPPILRRGCDLALEINLIEKVGVERILKDKKADYIDILPIKGNGELLEVVKVTDFDSAVMVKAGNMKLTFDRESGVVLNVSGGGCPDVPYLHAELLGRKLSEAQRPREKGHTLCSLMLDRAFVESLDIWSNGHK
ncbi:MAG TPA: DUF3343 domain-containing protein [Syntrophales bacterium]|nr:DUF3343 domain-containing protein [Syntrophales bacterium]HOX94731.1 DUF3343 domain-containing protein [Syntrophales bacterium]HPI56499.1 DUF3343 domain-containing protein [Syntrophales bacterium]HPN25080.1 DUF3343 domain-containing protein [Syntrophales bacterium]HQM29177.1 DUF3343 domain-containing protein [Syntrophales bacterium]